VAAVTVQQRLGAAPDFRVVREVPANDAALPTKKADGLNCVDFDEVVVQVTLSGAIVAADVEPHFWARSKDGTPNGGFVPESTPQVLHVDTNGVREVIRVAHHDAVFFEVSGIAGGAGAVRVEAAGVPIYGQKG
jgi:hypothetical protein